MERYRKTYSEDRNIDVATTNHGERFGRVLRRRGISQCVRIHEVWDSPNTEAPGNNVTVSFPALMRSLNMHVRVNYQVDADIRMPSNSRIELRFGRIRPHPKDPILALEPDAHILRQMLWHQRRHTNPKVNVEPIAQLPGRPTCNTVTKVLSGIRGAAVGLLGRYGPDFDLLLCCRFDDAVDVDSREMDRVGVERTDWDDVLCLGRTSHTSISMCGV